MQWLMANWQMIITALLAIDAVLIPIFPNATLFGKVKEWLTPLAPKQP